MMELDLFPEQSMTIDFNGPEFIVLLAERRRRGQTVTRIEVVGPTKYRVLFAHLDDLWTFWEKRHAMPRGLAVPRFDSSKNHGDQTNTATSHRRTPSKESIRTTYRAGYQRTPTFLYE